MFIQSHIYNRPFEGNHNADVALDENEFDTPALKEVIREKLIGLTLLQKKLKCATSLTLFKKFRNF